MADIAADQAREDFEIAQTTAKQFAPDFLQPGILFIVIFLIHICHYTKQYDLIMYWLVTPEMIY